MIAGQGGEQNIVQGKTGLRNGHLHCDILPGRSGRFTAGVKGTLREGGPRECTSIGTRKWRCRSGSRHSTDSVSACTARDSEISGFPNRCWLSESRQHLGTSPNVYPTWLIIRCFLSVLGATAVSPSIRSNSSFETS